jgi:hypothetical protein
LIALPAKLHEVIKREVLGLEPRDSGIGNDFNLYSIQEISVHLPKDADYTQHPLMIDGRNLPSTLRDIWRCENGAIVCTNRFASLLNSLWDGLPDVKFQPINCRHIALATLRLFTEPLDRRGGEADSLLSGLQDIETFLNLEFPESYCLLR